MTDQTFGGHTFQEVAELLDALSRAADRCEANSQQEISGIASRGRDALRALLAKPVATREVPTRNTIHRFIGEFGDKEGWDGRQLNDGHVVDAVIAALSHFAPPAAPLPPICGMSVDDIVYQFSIAWDKYVDNVDLKRADCIAVVHAKIVHRLAQQSVVDPDADAEAKAVHNKLYEHAPSMVPSDFNSASDGWKNACRAVAAADAARAVTDEDDVDIAAAVFGIAVAEMGKDVREGLAERGLKVVRA